MKCQIIFHFFIQKNIKNKLLIANCIATSLMNNYFLHFAGSLHEAKMWKNIKIYNLFDKKFIKNFENFKKKKLIGKPLGKITP